MEKQCQVCGSEMKYIPAGISHSSGRPYDAFWACPRKCKKTRQQNNSTLPANSDIKMVQEKDTDWEKISWGKCKFGFLVELMKKGVSLTEAEPISESWANAAMRRSAAS